MKFWERTKPHHSYLTLEIPMPWISIQQPWILFLDYQPTPSYCLTTSHIWLAIIISATQNQPLQEHPSNMGLLVHHTTRNHNPACFAFLVSCRWQLGPRCNFQKHFYLTNFQTSCFSFQFPPHTYLRLQKSYWNADCFKAKLVSL